MTDSSSLIIAIDFGTAYSGYCCYVTSNSDEIWSPVWGEEYGRRTIKTPTCILFNEQGDFLKFGYDALMTFKMRPKNGDNFFQNFKMELYNKTITRKLVINSTSNRPMLAMKVFSESMRFLKEHALKTVAQNTAGKSLIASDVTWVLTVPAIWDPAAKQFMREAATKAGLVTDATSSNLIIALEPEAASAWCKQLPSTGFISEGFEEDTLEQKPGTQYIVADCGGGTVDIAVHEILEGGYLQEIYKASGGDMGGESVDAKFICFLRDTFHPKLWDKYEKQHPNELQQIMFDFAVAKCVRNNDEVYIPCPYNLTVMAEQDKKMNKYFKTEDATWSEGSIKLTCSKVKTFFADSLARITKLISEIFATSEINPDYIFLVGGYAACEILQTEIKRIFGHRSRVLCPVDANLAVAKGAVLMGKNPKIVSSRICALTYGISECRSFNSRVHKREKRRVNKTEDFVYCTDLFYRLVQRNESVKCDEVKEYMFEPIDHDQTSMCFSLFSTEELDSMYIDGLNEIGSFTVPMPDTSKGRDREVKFEIKFGLTEMEATATDLTSRKTNSIRLDFLTTNV